MLDLHKQIVLRLRVQLEQHFHRSFFLISESVESGRSENLNLSGD
jgi:hypothetical protein